MLHSPNPFRIIQSAAVRFSRCTHVIFRFYRTRRQPVGEGRSPGNSKRGKKCCPSGYSWSLSCNNGCRFFYSNAAKTWKYLSLKISVKFRSTKNIAFFNNLKNSKEHRVNLCHPKKCKRKSIYFSQTCNKFKKYEFYYFRA